jgi:hypothetical protein
VRFGADGCFLTEDLVLLVAIRWLTDTALRGGLSSQSAAVSISSPRKAFARTMRDQAADNVSSGMMATVTKSWLPNMVAEPKMVAPQEAKNGNHQNGVNTVSIKMVATTLEGGAALVGGKAEQTDRGTVAPWHKLIR